MLFLHGGFWRQQYDRSHVGPIASALAAEGFPVVTPEYRRTGAPGGGWPGTLDDVAAGVRTVPALVAARTAVDPGRVVLAGHSAGGHLALWAAADLARTDQGVRAVVALAPIADLGAAYHLDLDGGAVAALLGGGPDEFPDRYVRADPLGLVPLRTRLALVHGTRDAHVPVDFSRRFAAAARAAGDTVIGEFPDVEHFSLIDPLTSAFPVVLAAFQAVVPA